MPEASRPERSPTPEATGQSSSPPAAKKTVLSRELADCLIELSIALHKHAMYPDGHPSLVPAVDGVTNRMGELLQHRSSLSLGVARDQLVIEGVATDSHNPVLTDLAGRLHGHHLGAITFLRGVSAQELHEFLQVIAQDPTREGRVPLGLGKTRKIEIRRHIKLYPVTYDQLELLEEEEGLVSKDEEEREARTRAAQLWLGLARASVAAADGSDFDEDGPLPDTDPTAVARAIDNHPESEAYDQVIVGYLLQIGDELKQASGAEGARLQKRISKLVSNLEQSTLNRLLEMGGDTDQRRRFLLDASQGLAIDAVVDLIRAGGEAEEQGISNSMLRMLQKLAHHAGTGAPARRQFAEMSVREQLAEVIQGWSLTDPNPDAYSTALGQMAQTAPVFQVSDEARFLPEPRRIVHMALEVNTAGPAVTRAVDQLVQAHQTDWLLDVLEKAEAPEVSAAVWEDLVDPHRLGIVFSKEPINVHVLDTVLRKVRLQAAGPMLEALVASESESTRRLFLDRLTQLGADIVPLISTHLDDSRWYVQRNMLKIIADLPQIPDGFDATEYVNHHDSRVRREAYHIMFRDPQHREQGICKALGDADEQTVKLAFDACMEDCPKAAVPLVASRALKGSSTAQRTAAVKVLGSASGSNPEVMEPLLTLVSPHRRFWRWKLPRRSPPYMAALEALATFRNDPNVRKVLEITARRSQDEGVAILARWVLEGTKEPA